MGNTHWLLQNRVYKHHMRKGNNLRHGLRKFRRRYALMWFQPSCFYCNKMACTCREVTRSGVTLFMPRLWHSCVNQTRRASIEVFPKLSSTFPDLQCSLSLAHSLSLSRRPDKSLNTGSSESRFGSRWRYSRSTSTRRHRQSSVMASCVSGIEVI